MQFDIRSYFKNGKTPYTAQFSEDFSKEDFDGSRVTDPVVCSFEATPDTDGVAMQLHVQAAADAECARCLAPVRETYDFTVDYFVRERDLQDPDFELPMDEKGCLDLRELAYQELIFKIPKVLLCSPDCQGLCPICGKRKAAGCTCRPADDAAPADARLSILKQLLS
ncbi:MAG: YceD family protein [Gemmiger sp.]|uniref:YceD family protein n=1 Tax=Gemmiger sp. TaxID=2049027 RepID=UPI002E76B307|nr:YceD family protein [Gemmiger sp.]MEE0801327.1 YceD family protein [Gemmiger sp.]